MCSVTLCTTATATAATAAAATTATAGADGEMLREGIGVVGNDVHGFSFSELFHKRGA
jgi:hypothetical protein